MEIQFKRRFIIFMIFLLLPLIATLADFPNPPPQQLAQKSGTETAVLAGGCFWGMEGVFERLTGVTEVVSGYSGGDSSSARYELVGIGTTGHAESIKITFDPSRITYASLLKVFFSIAHDPTELNYQGPDVGSQYRSVIFYNSAEQKLIAEEYIRTLEASREFPLPIVTQAAALNAFYPAEDQHQDFMKKHPDSRYIITWDLPKIRMLQATYPELLAKD